MFSIPEKYLGDEKKEAIRKFKLKDQAYRKKLHPVSRELYRYYNQRFHTNVWNPNGLFQRNKYYYFIGPSLGFIDQEGNKRYDKSEQNKVKMNLIKTQMKSFPEYNFLEENQYEIIIEYCSNCQEHQAYTFHKAELYQNYANYLQKCILLRFPFIKVILKPIDNNIMKVSLPKLNNNKKFEIRIGAFEVILSFKKKGNEIKEEVLYSKLEKKNFPVITNILDKIVKYLPTFNGQIILYEKEEKIISKRIGEINEENKEIEKLGKKELVEGLEINIYLLKNQQIINITNKAWEEIQNQQNPKKRLILIKEQQLKDKVKYSNKLIRSASMASITKKYNTQSDIDNKLNINDKLNLEEFNNNKSSEYNTMNKYIFDKNKSRNLKGKLIIRKYTNQNGIINIGPLPYDSYYIEVKESKQFRNIGFCLSFNDLNLYKDNFIKKYIGLLTQENAFIQIHVYEIKENNNNSTNDIFLLPNAKVTLKRIKENNKNNQEINIEIKESNKLGIFEHTVPPGKYYLEVIKSNYEKNKKIIELKEGHNIINVEMILERYYNLTIQVYNYENNNPIQNADITIYKNSSEILEESITNKNGTYNYLVDKGLDFLTIVIEKMDYFPVQRIFVRKSEGKINNKGEYEEKMIFYLVKKNYVRNNNLILIMTYGNILGNNFGINNIQISDKTKDKIAINFDDKQKDEGFLCTSIKYISKKMDSDISLNKENIEESQDAYNYDNIISISYKILSEKLRINNYEDESYTMNGLERFACQTIVCTAKNMFYIPSPSYSPNNYSIWFIGWIDIKNKLFYQINTLIPNQKERKIYLTEWLDFLQILIDDKIYTNLFEFFGFDKSILELGDRTLDSNIFEGKLKSMQYFKRKNSEIINFICSLFKNRNNMISFSLFKQNISSNLKNFLGNK